MVATQATLVKVQPSEAAVPGMATGTSSPALFVKISSVLTLSSGSSESYCGTGCDADFGSCTPSGSDIHDTTNGLCGPGVRASCGNYGDKTCCSQYGFW